MSVFRRLKKQVQLPEWEFDVFFIVVLFIGIGVGAYAVLFLTRTVDAVTLSWTQTDWSGGESASVATGTVNTYSAGSQVSPSTSITLGDSSHLAKLQGTQLLTGSTNFNSTTSFTAISFAGSQDYDTNYYSYAGVSPSRLTFSQNGDYFVSFTHSLVSSDSNNNRSAIESQIYLNGTPLPDAVGRSSYTRNSSSHNEGSNHITVLIENVLEGDYIEVYSRGYANTGNSISGPATLYAEYIHDAYEIFSATGTRTVASTDLNSSASAMQWTSVEKDSDFTHDNGSNSHLITAGTTGPYFVAVTIPLTSSSQRPNITGQVLVDGSPYTGTKFQNGYIRNGDGHDSGTINWSGVVNVTAGQTISIQLEQSASNGTVTVGSSQASLFIQRVDGNSIIAATGTQVGGADNWNPSVATTINWGGELNKNSLLYSHDTITNNQEITVNAYGDYLLSLNASFSSSVQRANPKLKVLVNGNAVYGAESKPAYIRSAGNHNNSSAPLLFPLMGLSNGDVVSISVEAEAASGTVNDDGEAQIVLWQKNIFSSGTITSNVFDASYPADWKELTYNTSGSGTVEVRVRTAATSDMAGATAWSACDTISSGTLLSTTNCVTDTHQYAQYQVTLLSDTGTGPSFDDISIDYESSDKVAPTTNASNITLTGYADAQWINVEPTITWDAGADDPSGAGLLGYCIALDEASINSPANLDPELSSGVLSGLDDGIPASECPFVVSGTSIDLSTITGLDLTSGNQYYLSLKAIDLGENIWSGDVADFQNLISFKYDDTPPNNPAYISMPSNFISTKSVTITWPNAGGDAPSDEHSGLVGLQYRIGEEGTWYGDLHTGTEDNTDTVANDGAYTTDEAYDYPELVEGVNRIFFRAIDTAGNTSDYIQGTLKINTAAPSPVQNLAVTPTDNTLNSYAFSWDPPSSTTGSINNITYCYSVNTLPSVSTCNYTGAGEDYLAAAAFATQPGVNTMYVVARDEANNINYDTFETVQFTYSGTAPGIPQGIDIADISIKANEDWKLAITWSPPEDVGAGVSTYKVFRLQGSANCNSGFENFSVAGSASGTSFVDTNLEQTTYSYCIQSCDTANNCSAVSSTVEREPTGRFIVPANLVSKPEVTALTARRASISWVTDRDSDSKIQYGTKSGEYFPEEVSKSEQLTSHTVSLINLEPGTTYYYRAKWTDEDGNTGFSEEKTFETLPPPRVLDLSVSDINLSSAIVTFTIENATEASVLYGLSENFGGIETVATSTTQSTYSIPLQGLQDGSTYFYGISLRDIDGFEYDVLQNNQFTTLPRPQIQSIQIQEQVNTAQPTVEVFWESNTAITSVISYYPEGQSGNELQEVDIEAKVAHAAEVTGLLPNTRYTMIISGRDSKGNEAISAPQSFTTASDTRPPLVSNIRVDGVINTTESGDQSAQLVVSWDSDEPATSQVEFGEGASGSFTQSTQIDKNLQFKHVVVISNLDPSTVYHLRVISRDEAENQTTSGSVVTITPQQTESALELVLRGLSNVFNFL